MERFLELQNFIDRAHEVCKEKVRENVRRATQYKKRHLLPYMRTEEYKKKEKVRREIKKAAWEALTEEEKKETWEFYKNRPLGYVVDHIIPLSKGGSHKVSNLQYLTVEQNSSKGNREHYNRCFE